MAVEEGLLDVRLRLVTARSRGRPGTLISRNSRGVSLVAKGVLTDVLVLPGDPIAILEAAGATILWPATWSDRAEDYHMLVPDRATLGRIVSQLCPLGEARLEAVAPMAAGAVSSGLASAALGAQLTSRQLKALSEAIARGYYDIPRRVEVVQMAREFGVSRATLQEHLRKAERVALRELSHSLAIVGQMGESVCKGRGRPRGSAAARAAVRPPAGAITPASAVAALRTDGRAAL